MIGASMNFDHPHIIITINLYEDHAPINGWQIVIIQDTIVTV